MTVHGSLHGSLGVALLLGGMAGCVTADSNDDDAVRSDESAALADRGDHEADPALADDTIDYTASRLVFRYSNGGSRTLFCSEGMRSSTRPLSSWPWPNQASNGCATRVWLYENSNSSGYTLCLNPHSDTGTLHRTYREFYVSVNASRCP
jgi:hypothetical protein